MTWTAAGTFSKDAGFDFEARCTIGRAAVAVGDVGLALATLDRIGDDGPQAWFDQWSATARGLAARAETATAAGHRKTASWAYLAAADYFAVALGAVDGLADQSVLAPTFAEHRRCWDGGRRRVSGQRAHLSLPSHKPRGAPLRAQAGCD